MAEEIRIGLAVVSDAGTRKTIAELAEVRKKIADLKGEFKSGAKDVDTFGKELAGLEKEARKLDKALDEVGEKRRIDIESGQLGDATQQGAGTGLRRAGRELRNLPSVQIPGLGIGTDAVGNLTRVSGALIDVTEKSKTAAIAATLLTPALGAQAAATAAAYAPIAILVAGFVAIGLALKALVDSTSTNADRINALAEKQRDLNTEIANGLSTEDAQEKLDKLTAAQERNKATLAELQGGYDQAQKELGVLGGAVKVFSGDEEALSSQISETNKTIADQQAEMDVLSKALNDGSLAANDTAESEAKLAEIRTQNVLKEASQAGDLASLKERASELTQEQIDKELEALERRKTGIEAELTSLESSGDKSEEVAKKITELKDSLGFLGEQSDVLKNARKTAKSDKAEKEKEKAAKEAEKEAERQAKAAQKRIEDTAKAQQNYNDKLADARTQFKDTVQDIGRSLKDNLSDNLRKLDDDLREGSIEFNQDQLAEERAYQRDLAQIKQDAANAEKDAVRSRDFAALADAREQGQAALNERQTAEQTDNSEQLIEFQNHRAALARARQDADRDAQIDAQRAERDATIQRHRAFRDAATDRDRALRDINGMEQSFQRNSLSQWQQYFNQLLDMQGQLTGKRTNTGTGIGTTAKSGGSSFDQMAFMIAGGS